MEKTTKRNIKRADLKPILWVWLGAMVGVMVLVMFFSAQKNGAPKAPPAAPSAGAYSNLEGIYNQIAQVMNEITVSIYEGSGGAQPVLLGSGIVVSSKWILTNLHIVYNKAGLTAGYYFPGKGVCKVAMLMADAPNDLAILEVTDGFMFSSTAGCGNSDVVDAGDIVFSMGNAFGNGNILTSGIIIDNNYSYTVNSQNYAGMFRTNINTYPGVCGGPLVNINGEVIGIVNSAGCGQNNYVGIGNATPINRAIAILNGNVQAAFPNCPTPGLMQGQNAIYRPQSQNGGNPYSLA
jgi:serine protease Do